MTNYRNGLPSGRGKKPIKLEMPSWQGFATYLVFVARLRAEHGQEFAIHFVNESKKRYQMDNNEFEFAMSIAKR